MIPKKYRYLLEEPLPLSAGAQGKRGTLDLVLGNRNGKTILERRYAQIPLYVYGPLYIDQKMPDMAYLYLVNPTGGIVQGDRICLNLKVGEDCKGHVTTQSANKVYGMESNCAVQQTTIEVYKNSYLEFLPDHTIPYRDSRFFQFTEIRAHRDATIFFWDIVCPGRYVRGEEFEYDVYYSSLKVFVDGELRLVDTVCLNPKENDPRRTGILGKNKFLANVYVISNNYDELLEETENLGAGGVTPNNVFVLRILEKDWLRMKKILSDIWLKVRRVYLNSDLPPPRKY